MLLLIFFPELAVDDVGEGWVAVWDAQADDMSFAVGGSLVGLVFGDICACAVVVGGETESGTFGRELMEAIRGAETAVGVLCLKEVSRSALV